MDRLLAIEDLLAMVALEGLLRVRSANYSMAVASMYFQAKRLELQQHYCVQWLVVFRLTGLGLASIRRSQHRDEWVFEYLELNLVMNLAMIVVGRKLGVAGEFVLAPVVMLELHTIVEV